MKFAQRPLNLTNRRIERVPFAWQAANGNDVLWKHVYDLQSATYRKTQNFKQLCLYVLIRYFFLGLPVR